MPGKALTPARMRAISDGLKSVMHAGSGYAGGSTRSHEIGLYRPPMMSADAAISADGNILRQRARDLVRNNPIARQAVRIARLATIGTTFKLSLQPDVDFLGIDRVDANAWAKFIEQAWRRYAEGTGFWSDAGRRLTFPQQMGLAHDCLFTDGESLMSVEWAENRPWSTCFKEIDVDRLSNAHGYPETQYLRHGVQLDELGAPVAYHIRTRHPSDGRYVGTPDDWQIVPRETEWGRPVVLHCFQPGRAEQTRGVTEFASVIQALVMGQRFVDTELANAVIQSSYAAVLTSQMDYKDAAEAISDAVGSAGGDEDITGYVLDHLAETSEYYTASELTFEGVKIPKLWPGDKLELVTPQGSHSASSDFKKFNIRSIASGTGSDPSALSQDYSDVNFSSARAANAANWRTYEERRSYLTAQTAMPAVGAWLEEGIAAGILPMPRGVPVEKWFEVRDALVRGTFKTQGRPMIDPTKERQAQKNGVDLGVTTLGEIASAEGKDLDEVADEMAAEMAMFAERGLTHPQMIQASLAGFAPADDEEAENTDDGTDSAGGEKP